MSRWSRALRTGVASFLLANCVAGTPLAENRAAGLDSWFPRLREGMWIKVEGQRRTDGVLQATEIKILDGELDEWEIESYVAGVDLVHMKLSTTLGLDVVANAKTRLDGPDGQKSITFAFFEVGDKIEIEGQWQSDGTILAEDIDIEKSKRLQPDMVAKNKHEIRGRIDKLDATAHQVELVGITVQFDTDTKNKTKVN